MAHSNGQGEPQFRGGFTWAVAAAAVDPGLSRVAHPVAILP
jgi:hypothetical protein